MRTAVAVRVRRAASAARYAWSAGLQHRRGQCNRQSGGISRFSGAGGEGHAGEIGCRGTPTPQNRGDANGRGRHDGCRPVTWPGILDPPRFFLSMKTRHAHRVQVLAAGQAISATAARHEPQSYQVQIRAAKERFGAALCSCQKPPLQLVIRERSGKLFLAAWPDQAATHALDCPFYSEHGPGGAVRCRRDRPGWPEHACGPSSPAAAGKPRPRHPWLPDSQRRTGPGRRRPKVKAASLGLAALPVGRGGA